MGNFVSCRTLDANGGKVVLFDGTIHEFDRPISVAELMLDHPRLFVVDMQSLSAGTAKVTPLPADHMLDPNKAYLMLPMARRKVSADEARRILSLARSALRSRSLPFWAKNLGLVPGICMARVHEKEMKVPAGRKDDSLMEGEEMGGAEESPEVFGAESEFLRRTVSSKGWKPSLRTIEEKAMEKKVSHWLF